MGRPGGDDGPYGELMTVTPEQRFDQISRSIANVRGVDFQALNDDQSSIAIGWLLGALDQMELIAAATRLGLVSALAPSRRLIFELAIRLKYLDEHGDDAVNAVKIMAKRDMQTLRKHAGEEWAASHSEIDTVLALATEAKRNEHLGSIASYTDSADDMEGFYIAWWSETNNSHASMHLALSYVLPDGPGVKASKPAGADPAHDQMMLVGLYAVTSVYNVLKRMKHTAVADAILNAWLGGLAIEGVD